MKNPQTTALCAILISSTFLPGCGGGATSAPAQQDPVLASMGGTISSLAADSTTLLLLNGGNAIAVSGSGNFVFEKKLSAGSSYEVSLFTQPRASLCKVANGTGVVSSSGSNVTNISVTCEPALSGLLYYNVGAAVTGLKAGSAFTLRNNGADTLTVNENGLSLFANRYSNGIAPAGGVAGAYSVSLASNPPGQTCTLTNASGVVGPPSYPSFVKVDLACQ
jgi:hypothetical protein